MKKEENKTQKGVEMKRLKLWTGWNPSLQQNNLIDRVGQKAGINTADNYLAKVDASCTIHEGLKELDKKVVEVRVIKRHTNPDLGTWDDGIEEIEVELYELSGDVKRLLKEEETAHLQKVEDWKSLLAQRGELVAEKELRNLFVTPLNQDWSYGETPRGDLYLLRYNGKDGDGWFQNNYQNTWIVWCLPNTKEIFNYLRNFVEQKKTQRK